MEGIEAPERAVLGDGMVLWYDWASSGIVVFARDDPSRVVTLGVDASAHAWKRLAAKASILARPA